MSFANQYFNRFTAKNAIIKEVPASNLFLSIVIPVYDEPDLCASLQSLKKCEMPKQSVEVIVIINSSENSTSDIVLKNKYTFEKAKVFAKENSNSSIKFHILNYENLPKKFAGVGLARKIGMDEALHRFNKLEKANGLIAGFDADALVNKNYFVGIENYFNNNSKINIQSPQFVSSFFLLGPER